MNGFLNIHCICVCNIEADDVIFFSRHFSLDQLSGFYFQIFF